MNERKIGIAISYLNIGLQAVIGFLYVPLLLYYIGQSEYGLYQLIGSLIAYFSIMDFGLTNAVVRFYARYRALRDRKAMENILAVAVRMYAGITVLVLAIGYICYLNLGWVFSDSMDAAEIAGARDIFALLLFNIGFTLLTMVFRAVINAYEKFLFLKGMETVQLVFQPVLVLLILQEYPSAFSVALVQTFLNVVLSLARAYYCFAHLHIKIRFHNWNRELLGDFRKLALSLFAVSIIDQIFFKTNQVILGIIDGTDAVAVYSIASLIYMNYMALSVAISGVYLPHVTEMIAKKEPMKQISDLFIKIGRLQYFLLALVTTGFIIFGQEFIRMWAGPDFLDAYWMTLLIIIPFTIDLIQNIGLSILQAQNQYDFRAKVYLAMGIFNLCLAIPLGERYGGIGCAFATGLSMFLGNGLIMNWYYAKVTHLAIGDFWKSIGWISLPVIFCAAIGKAGYTMFDTDGSTIGFVGGVGIYTLLYVLCVYKWGMNTQERMMCRSLLQRLR